MASWMRLEREWMICDLLLFVLDPRRMSQGSMLKMPCGSSHERYHFLLKPLYTIDMLQGPDNTHEETKELEEACFQHEHGSYSLNSFKTPYRGLYRG